jgi:hypothetical protein
MPNSRYLDFAGFMMIVTDERPGDLHQMQPEFV